MAETYILALIGVGIVALVVGVLGSLILKALGVLWNKAGGSSGRSGRRDRCFVHGL
jgi:hypothetical protein